MLRDKKTCLYATVECLMMSGNDKWPFVWWLFVRVAFYPGAMITGIGLGLCCARTLAQLS